MSEQTYASQIFTFTFLKCGCGSFRPLHVYLHVKEVLIKKISTSSTWGIRCDVQAVSKDSCEAGLEIRWTKKKAIQYRQRYSQYGFNCMIIWKWSNNSPNFEEQFTQIKKCFFPLVFSYINNCIILCYSYLRLRPSTVKMYLFFVDYNMKKATNLNLNRWHSCLYIQSSIRSWRS